MLRHENERASTISKIPLPRNNTIFAQPSRVNHKAAEAQLFSLLVVSLYL